MIRRPPRSTRVRSSAASDVYKRQVEKLKGGSDLFTFDGPVGLDEWVDGVILNKVLQFGLAVCSDWLVQRHGVSRCLYCEEDPLGIYTGGLCQLLKCRSPLQLVM